jgi:hypothetical protein
MDAQTLINGKLTVEDVLKNVIAGYEHLVQSKSAIDAISKFPALAHLTSEIADFIPGIQQGMAVANILLEYGPVLYTVGRTINIAPMEAGKSVHDNDLSNGMGD